MRICAPCTFGFQRAALHTGKQRGMRLKTRGAWRIRGGDQMQNGKIKAFCIVTYNTSVREGGAETKTSRSSSSSSA